MYCLTNICYVCLKKKNNLISSVNSSVSVNEELRRIIGYHAFNQPWLKSKRIVLICEECYSLLRKTYQFLKMWRKNSALLKGYIDLLNTTTIPNTGNEAELHVHVDIKQTDINDVKREVKLEDEQIYTFQWEHNIEETDDALVDIDDSLVEEIIYEKKKVAATEAYPTVDYSTAICDETNDVFVNLEDSFVKEENTWKREEVDDTEECPTDNNADLSNTDSVSSGFAGKQIHATNKGDLNIATKKSYKCSTCSKYFVTKSALNIHTRIHTEKKSYECAICKKRYNYKVDLVIHIRVHTGEKPYKCTTCKNCFASRAKLVTHIRTHTGEKPYECTTCKKCFTNRSNLATHIRTHTDEKPYECSTCKKCFTNRSTLVIHMRTHTGEKPYECAMCKKCFRQRSALVAHTRLHNGEKPYECATCKKCFTQQSSLIIHKRTHTGEKPFECATCKKCFACHAHLAYHMVVHTDEKPYKCSKCSKCFRKKSNVKSHMRNKHPDDEPH